MECSLNVWEEVKCSFGRLEALWGREGWFSCFLSPTVCQAVMGCFAHPVPCNSHTDHPLQHLHFCFHWQLLHSLREKNQSHQSGTLVNIWPIQRLCGGPRRKYCMSQPRVALWRPGPFWNFMCTAASLQPGNRQATRGASIRVAKRPLQALQGPQSPEPAQRPCCGGNTWGPAALGRTG